MPFTARDLETVQFSTAPIGKRGYHKGEVDDLLDRIAPTLNNQGNVSAEAINNVAFAKPPFRQRGYNEDEVDAFLDLAAAEINRLLAEGTITLHPETDAKPSIAAPLHDKKRPKRDGRHHTDGTRA